MNLSHCDRQKRVFRRVGSIVRTMLANGNSIKCIQDGDQHVFVSCVAHLLENLETENHFEHMLNEAVQAHHCFYGTCTKTLVTMATFWEESAVELLHKGIPHSVIVENMTRYLEVCIEHLLGHSIPINEYSHVRTMESSGYVPHSVKTPSVVQAVSHLGQGDGNFNQEIFLRSDYSDCSGRTQSHEQTGTKEKMIHYQHGNGFEKQGFTSEQNTLCGSGVSDVDRMLSLSSEVVKEELEDQTKSDGNGFLPCQDPASDVTQGAEVTNANEGAVPSKYDYHSLQKDTVLNAEVACDEESRVDAEDDLSWFFSGVDDNGSERFEQVVLQASEALDKLQSDFANMIVKGSSQEGGNRKHDMVRLFDEFGEFESEEMNSSSAQEIITSIRPVPSVGSNEMHCQNNACENESDDEFDACFDDTDFTSESNEPLKHGAHDDSAEKGKMSAQSTSQKCDVTDDDFDDFDSCFDNIEFKDQSEDVGYIDTTPTQPVVCKNKRTNHVENATSKTIGDSPKDFELILQKKLEEKRREQSASQIFNQSRHFKTVELSVDEMQHSHQNVESGLHSMVDQHVLKSAANDGLHDNSSTSSHDKLPLPSDSKEVTFERLLMDKMKTDSKPRSKSLSFMNSSRHLRIDCTDEHIEDIESHITSEMCSTSVGSSSLENNETDSEVSGEEVKYASHMVNRSNKPTAGSEHVSDNVVNNIGKHDHMLNWLGEGLSHGQEEMMSLVIKAAKRQNISSETVGVEVSKILSVAVEGPSPSHSCVLDGVVVTVPAPLKGFLQYDKQRNVVLVNGDLSASFKHLGYKQLQKVQYELQSLPSGDEKSWSQQVQDHLSKLNVSALMVKGMVDSDIFDVCLADNIAVFEYIPYNYLKNIAEATGKHMVTYISDATADNVISHMTLSMWEEDWLRKLPLEYVVMDFHCGIQTAVVCHQCPQISSLRQEEFLHCLRRLENIFKGGKLLKGGGDSEQICFKYLTELADESRVCNNYEGEILQALASGFRSYNYELSKNAQVFKDVIIDGGHNMAHVLDDFDSKLQSWRSAVNLVCLRLLTDYQVTTGVTEESQRRLGSDWTML